MTRQRTSDAKPAATQASPLRPRPKMLIGLSVVFVLWVAFLLTMYFTTVYPQRYIEDRPDPDTRSVSLMNL